MKLPFSRAKATVAVLPEPAPRIELPPEYRSDLRLNKLCEAEDFRNLTLLDVMRRVFSHLSEAIGPTWPAGQEQRKLWEVAMAILTLERHRKMNPDALILGVGAGVETTTFYLTNFVRQVFATDLYANPNEWTGDAPPTMLTHPASLSPIPCNPRRLVVQHMDGRNLLYEDEMFDAVYSSSSIEHFGDWEDVSAAAREIGFDVVVPKDDRRSAPCVDVRPHANRIDMHEVHATVIEHLLDVERHARAVQPDHIVR